MVATRAWIAARGIGLQAAPRAALRARMAPIPMRRIEPVRVQTRHASTARPLGTVSVKAGVLFAGLTALAFGLTVYGVWEYLAAFRVWPKELREPLRAALKAKNRGNLARSAKKFREALDIARTLEPRVLGADPVLKISGIAIALADVLEQDNKFQDAALVYLDALDEVLGRGAYAAAAAAPRTALERMRAIGLAQKIGDLAEHNGAVVPAFDDGVGRKTNDPAEGYLSWSVDELLRLLRSERAQGEEPALLSELHLPPWVAKQDIGASVEALGAFYAARGVAEYAVPLYLQAISILLPAAGTGQKSAPPTVAERCRAAILMNNISQVLAQGKRPALPEGAPAPSASPLDQASAWATKGLDLVTITSYRAGFLSSLPDDEQEWLLRFSGFEPAKVGLAPVVEAQNTERFDQVKNQCLGTQFVLLYNLAMYHDMRSDQDTARTLFRRAMRHADRLGLREARAQCARSLARMDRK